MSYPHRIYRRWTAAHLRRWYEWRGGGSTAWSDGHTRDYFRQRNYWITANADLIHLRDMAPQHALNAVLFLERVAGDLPFPGEQLQRQPLYIALKARVEGAFRG